MVRVRVIVPAIAIVLGSVASAAPAQSLPVSAAASIAFSTPTVVDPIHTNGEPDIGIDPQVRVFVSGPTGTGTQGSTWFGSVDGGRTFRVITPGLPPNAITGINDPPGGGDTDINFDHNGKQYFADLYALLCLRTATTSDGGATVKQGLLGCDPLCNGPGADRQWLAVFDPAGASTSPYAGPRPLIYLEYHNLVGPNQDWGGQWNKNPDTLFTVASMDAGRNLFVAYALSAPSTNPGQRQVFVSVASPVNNWGTWTVPVRVSDGSTSTGDAVNVFPWIKAGGAGRADAVWYGSNLNVDPSSHNGQAWNVFMNQVVFPTDSRGAITGAPPPTTLLKATPPPLHYDDICLQGTNCILSTGNRNLADFFAVTVDATGAAEVVYDDTSNGLIQNPIPPTIPQAADHAGAGVITIARQSSGLGLLGTPVSGSSNAPVSGLGDPSGDALYPVIGGSNVSGMDIVGHRLSLSSDGKTLNVITQVVNLSNPAATAAAITGTTFLQYVTRWQMGNTIYYAAMSNTPANRPDFYAGSAQSVDLCSVSACFPHVITYPEPDLGGNEESGSIQCPAVPSISNPCTLTVSVRVKDVGSPTSTSRLEEVGSYSFAASHQQGATTNPQAEADNVPLEIDGVCCYNFQASIQNGGPPPCHAGAGDGRVSNGHGGKAHVHFDKDVCGDRLPRTA